MPTYALSPVAKQQFCDTNGIPYALGTLTSYAAGTSNLLATKTDATGAVANANPLTLDAAGRAGVWLQAGVAYKLVLKDALGSTIWTVDQIVLADASALDTALQATIMAAFLAGAGSSLVGFIESGAGAIARTVQDELRNLPYSLERFGGGPAASAATNDAAWALVKAKIGSSNAKSIVQFHAGTYETALGFDLPADAYQITLQGVGKGRTILKQTDATKHNIIIPTTGTPQSITIRDMEIRGSTSTANTGNGLHHGGSNEFFGLRVDNVAFQLIPNDAVHLPATAFTALFIGCDVGDVGGHGFYAGGNSTSFIGCYVHNLKTANKAGYRILGATVAFIGCNGVDEGDVWADLGASTVAADNPGGVADGADNYCYASFIGCNIENHSNIGINVRNGGINLIASTAFVDNTSGGNTSIRIRGRFTNGQGGIIDRGALFGTGGNYDNGYAVHSRSAASPFQVITDMNNQYVSFYDENAGAAVTMSTIGQAAVTSGRYGQTFRDLRVTSIRSAAYAGTAVLVAGTKAISFSALGLADLPTNGYRVNLSRRAVSGAAYGFYATSHATTGFTITSENVADVGSIEWEVVF